MSDMNMGRGESQGPVRPHRGGTILTLGILGLATAWTFCGGIILGIVAWVMGRRDLGEMDRGVMSPEGRGTTQAGTICGIIAIPLSVVAIFVIFPIMAAIFFPVFMRARGNAQQTTCLSNEKQICLAMMMFAQDHNNTLPKVDRWTEDIYPYTKNTGLLHCPEDESTAKSSYGMNAALSGKKLSDIADPANTVLLYEAASPGDSPSGGAEDVARPGRHNDGNNFGYADGHVKWERETPAFGP